MKNFVSIREFQELPAEQLKKILMRKRSIPKSWNAGLYTASFEQIGSNIQRTTRTLRWQEKA